MVDGPRIEYVEARRVLLDALGALERHLNAITLVGAQAVYLRTTGRLPAYQPFTTDADLVLDPQSLGPAPPLGEAMRLAGFVLTPEPGVWETRIERTDGENEIVIPVDLIVPEHVAARAGRRSARLPGNHGKSTARKALGLEGALVDHSPMPVEALDADDSRTLTVSIAGVGALFVAKSHKLGERLAKPDRLDAKDAGDVYRLFDVTPPEDMATLLRPLLADDRSARATELAIEYARRLFLTPTSPGVRLAVTALQGIIPEATVVTVVTTYTLHCSNN